MVLWLRERAGTPHPPRRGECGLWPLLRVTQLEMEIVSAPLVILLANLKKTQYTNLTSLLEKLLQDTFFPFHKEPNSL